MRPGLGAAGLLPSDSDLLGTLWDRDALGQGGSAGLD